MPPETILVGIAMGLAFAAPPGVVTAETLRRGMNGGFALAFRVQLGSIIGDATYAVLALAGLAALAQNHVLQIALGAAGALFLMFLARSALKGAQGPASTLAAPTPANESRGAFLGGLALSLTNPWAIAFWLSLGGALTSLGLVHASGAQIALFFASFMIGSGLWAVLLSVAIAKMRQWVRPTVFRFASLVCGIALGAFGLAAAGRVALTLLGV